MTARLRSLCHDDGWGVLELVVAASLSLVVAAVLATAMVVVSRIDAANESDIRALDELLVAHEALARDVRAATTVDLDESASGLPMTVTLPSEGGTRTVTWSLSGSELRRASAGVDRVLASAIDAAHTRVRKSDESDTRLRLELAALPRPRQSAGNRLLETDLRLRNGRVV